MVSTSANYFLTNKHLFEKLKEGTVGAVPSFSFLNKGLVAIKEFVDIDPASISCLSPRLI